MHRRAIIGAGDISRSITSDLQAVAPGSITAVRGRSRDRAHAFAAEHITQHPWHGRDETVRIDGTMDEVLERITAAQPEMTR